MPKLPFTLSEPIEPFQTSKFVANIVLETSMLPTVTDLGKAKCEMSFYIHDWKNNEKLPKTGTGSIEWIVEYLDEKGNLNGDEDVEHIGIWFEDKTLTDYDGVFELPKEAIKLLRKSGIRVPRDFEPDKN